MDIAEVIAYLEKSIEKKEKYQPLEMERSTENPKEKDPKFKILDAIRDRFLIGVSKTYNRPLINEQDGKLNTTLNDDNGEEIINQQNTKENEKIPTSGRDKINKAPTENKNTTEHSITDRQRIDARHAKPYYRTTRIDSISTATSMSSPGSQTDANDRELDCDWEGIK